MQLYAADATISVSRLGELARERLGIGTSKADEEARGELRQRVVIDAGRIKPFVDAEVDRRYETVTARAVLKRYTSDTANLGREVPAKVVTAYRHQPVREVIGATAAQETAIAAAIQRSQTAALFPTIAATSWWCGPVYLVPWKSADRVTWHAWHAHDAAVIREGGEVLGLLALDRTTGESEVADRTGVYRYDKSGRLIEFYASDRCLAVEVYSRPASAFADLATEAAFGAALHQTAIQIGVIAAELDWVRKAQKSRILAFGGRTFGSQNTTIQADGPEQIVLDPELAISLGENEVINAIDFDTPIREFVAHLEHKRRQALATYGLDVVAAVNAPGAYDLAGAALAAHRTGQVEALASCERRALEVLLHASRLWAVGGNLPDPLAGEVEVSVRFATGQPVADPLRAEELYRLQARRGGTNPIEAYQRDHPTATATQAREAVERNIEETARISGALADRRAPVRPEVVFETEAEQTGREGGLGGRIDD